MTNKNPKLIQLTSPTDRFKTFNGGLDKILTSLDDLGEQYPDLGFRRQDVEDLSNDKAIELKEELKHHAQLILGLINHPLVQILKENREALEDQGSKELYDVPSGVWQHYKGTKYQILEQIQSTDYHLPGIIYQEENKPHGTIYAITLVNFYRVLTIGQDKINRFVKVSD